MRRHTMIGWALALLSTYAGAAQESVPDSAELPQILWQRSLEDALALAEAEGRALFIAVNMDGESASERIVRELYRKPEFVAGAQRFVCVVGSLFRHNERDRDARGLRIPCPRLGEVTCGEHIALEPILYERFLGGNRIAPRHAVVALDGTKSFDTTLLFDFRDLEAQVHAAASAAPSGEPAVRAPSGDQGGDRGDDLFDARACRARSAWERTLATADAEALEVVLSRYRAAPERLNDDVTAVLFARAADLGARWGARVVELALARPGERDTALWRAVVQGAGLDSGAGAGGLGPRGPSLALLARTAASAADRSLVASYWAVAERGDEADWARGAFELQLERETAVDDAVRAGGGPLVLGRYLELARKLPVASRPAPAERELAPLEELEEAIASMDAPLRGDPQNVELKERFGRTALDLARRRMESGGGGIPFLLSDARRNLEAANAARGDDVELLLLLARTAYYESDFAGQERYARRAWHALPELEEGTLDVLLGRREASDEQLRVCWEAFFAEPQRQEILRWQGDAGARLLEERAGADLALEAGGMASAACSMALVALSPTAEDRHWRDLSAVLAAFGRRAEETAIARAALARFPESSALRDALHTALWSSEVGRSDLAAEFAEELALDFPDSATSRWYAGYAWLFHGDMLRRAGDAVHARRALEAYELARAHFDACTRLEPGFQESADYYRGFAHLGAGFAQLLLEDRAAAADELVEAVRAWPALRELRDGQDREPVDLLDMALEWRASGPSPVSAPELCERLVAVDPDAAFWARAVADTQLREGLRSDGRGEYELGDRYMLESIAIARRALEVPSAEGGEAPTGPRGNARALAQSASVHAERLLDRGRAREAAPWLVLAAQKLEMEPPQGPEERLLREGAARLRLFLGAPRPRFRPGR